MAHWLTSLRRRVGSPPGLARPVLVSGVVLWMLVVVAGGIGLSGAAAQSSNGCFFVSTNDGDGDDRATTVVLEGIDVDFTDLGETMDDSGSDRCGTEASFDTYLFEAPTGEYRLWVVETGSPTTYWGIFAVTVTADETEYFDAPRGGVYSKAVDVTSPRDSARLAPGETASVSARLYNGQPAGSHDVELEIYVFERGTSRPGTPYKTIRGGSIGAEHNDELSGSFSAPDEEGEYEVVVAVYTDFDSIGEERLTDFIEWGRITVEAFDPPRIDGVSPAADHVSLTTEETRTFSITTSDPDTPPSELAITWAVDGEAVASGKSFTFDPSRHGAGVHTVSVTVSDGMTTTADASASWSVEVIRPPVIETVEPGNAEVVPGKPVTFRVAANDPGGHTPLSYTWTIDGERYEGPDVERTFTTTGTAAVTVDVTNSRGVTTTHTFILTVRNADPTITALTSSARTVTAGETVSLSATATDPETRDLAFDYVWTADDTRTHRGRTPELTLREVGTHEVTVTVRNPYGGTSRRSLTITVENDRTDLVDRSPDTDGATVLAGRSLRFVAEVVDHDASSVEARFFVDGDLVDTKTVSRSPSRVAYDHRFTTPGQRTVELVAEDGHGAERTLAWDVTVESRPPEITAWSPAEASITDVRSGEPIEFSVNATDPDGTTVSYEWHVDGEYVGSGATYRHQFGRAGRYEVSVTAIDDHGTQTTHAWDVNVRSFAEPLAVDTQLTTTQFSENDVDEFVTVSVRNPSVNERTARIELVIEVPDGFVASTTHDVAQGDRAAFVGYGLVAPGEQASISVSLQPTDGDVPNAPVPVRYQVLYFPSDNRLDHTSIGAQTVEISVAGADSATRSAGAETDGSTVVTNTDGQPGFTVAGTVLALLAVAGFRRWRRA